jgi:hypothetical protein
MIIFYASSELKDRCEVKSLNQLNVKDFTKVVNSQYVITPFKIFKAFTVKDLTSHLTLNGPFGVVAKGCFCLATIHQKVVVRKEVAYMEESLKFVVVVHDYIMVKFYFYFVASLTP